MLRSKPSTLQQLWQQYKVAISAVAITLVAFAAYFTYSRLILPNQLEQRLVNVSPSRGSIEKPEVKKKEIEAPTIGFEQAPDSTPKAAISPMEKLAQNLPKPPANIATFRVGTFDTNQENEAGLLIITLRKEGYKASISKVNNRIEVLVDIGYNEDPEIEPLQLKLRQKVQTEDVILLEKRTNDTI